MSTRCSAAILRTRGVDFVRRRCSAVWTPPSPSLFIVGAGAGADGGGGAALDGSGLGGAAAFGGSGFAGAGAAAGFDATAPASVSSTATSVCTGTVCPSCTLISARTPAAGAGISASTLSVEISNNGSSRFTGSPTFLSHLLKVPSAIDSPICGINTSTRAMFSPKRFLVPGVWCQKCHRHQEPDTRHLVFRQPSRRFHYIVRLGQDEVLKSRCIRQRHIVRGHPHDRPVEPLKRLLVDARGDLARDATGPRVLVHDQHLVRLLHGRDDRPIIQRQQRPQIEHFHRQAIFVGELVGGFQRFPQRGTVGNYGKMLPLARQARLPDRRENFFARGQLFLDPPIQPFVLEIQHGIVIADRGLDQALRVPDRRGIDDRVFILGEDVGLYGGAFKVTEGFTKRFGEARVIDTPISEAAIVGAAAGAAHMGLRPVAEMQFIDFISCAYDMLTNYVATARYRAGLATPIVVRGPCGGFVRGGPSHSQTRGAGFFHRPGLKSVRPWPPREARALC